MADNFPKYSNLLLTTDFSELSGRAIPHAISIAKKFRSKIYVLHVIEPVISPLDYSWGSVHVDELSQDQTDKAEKDLISWCEKHIPDEIDTRVTIKKGFAVNEILLAIDQYEIDLMVMATHGHTGVAHVLFGSTTERVLKKSKIPVLTIR